MPAIYPPSTKQRSMDVLPHPESIRKRSKSSSHHVRRKPSPVPRPNTMIRSYSGTELHSNFQRRPPSPVQRPPSSVPRPNTMKKSSSYDKLPVDPSSHSRAGKVDKSPSPMRRISSSSSSSSPGAMLKRLSSREKILPSPIRLEVRSQNSQNNYFPKKSTIDNEISSVTSAPSLSKEGRQQSQSPTSFQKDNSMREMSPLKKLSDSDKSVKMKKEEKLAIRRCIEALNRHLNDEKRREKLNKVHAKFDHWDELRHEVELNYGAANVLSLALTMTQDDDELEIICSCLEMVFRTTQNGVQAAYSKTGPSAVPWLLQLLKQAERGNLKHADSFVLNITKIIYYWSRVPDIRMLVMRHSGMVEMLQRVTTLAAPESKIARMRIIANLANSDENKSFFMENLLDSVLQIAVIDESDEARKCASSTLMDLASCSDNQVKMANNDRVMGTLVKLTTSESNPDTREAAIAGLQNLAFCQSNRVRLVTYSNGVVLDAMKKTLASDLNDKARMRAAGTLTNMACEETAKYMGNHKGLLQTLAVVSKKDDNSDVQGRGAMALTKIAWNIESDMTCYKTLMDALIVASLSNANNPVSQVLRAQARSPKNRYSMARHPGILDTLSDICLDSNYAIADKENAIRAIMHLSNEESNRKIMCKKTVLNALVTCAGKEGGEWRDISESAIVGIERLATNQSNRAVMGRHPSLLCVVAKVTEREQKEIDAGIVSSHERLAKQLLLSLLLAM